MFFLVVSRVVCRGRCPVFRTFLVGLYPTETRCAEEYEVYAQQAVFLLLWIHYYVR